jgi:hypothetical protein
VIGLLLCQRTKSELFGKIEIGNSIFVQRDFYGSDRQKSLPAIFVHNLRERSFVQWADVVKDCPFT